MIDWNYRFLKLAQHISQWSKDPSTKCGAVIVGPLRQKVAYGYNGFPIGVDDMPQRYNNREVKYDLVVHAELNAILNAQFGLSGSTLYVYPLVPCTECAKAIIQSGIKRVVSIKNPPSRPKGSKYIGVHPSVDLMFNESNVTLKLYEWPVAEVV